MIRSFRFVTFATLVLLVTGAAAFAQGQGAIHRRGPGGPGTHGGLGAAAFSLGALNLTEAQREQVRQLTQQHREQTRTLMERMRAAQTAREEAVDTLPVDEGRIRAVMEDLAAVQADLAVHQARLHSEIFAILTPEQQEQARQLRAERQARMKEHQGRMQKRLQSRRPRPQA
jgi:Spy/CpxP family protein refolding chaperone